MTGFERSLPFYPFGVQYHRAPTPLPCDWDGDLRQIARSGYTHVQFRPQWRWHERIHGQFVWNDLDQLFELAHKHRLRVVLKPMLETAPDWVYSELGATRIGFGGRPISPVAIAAFYVGGWLPCFDNPQCLDAALAFTRELVRRYCRHPALWFYNAWNEPRSRPLDQCQCRHSTIAYQRWLRQRFGSIEAMNEALGKAWTSFESVQPAHAASDYIDLYLWRTWAAQEIAEPVRRVTQVIREVDPDAFVLAHVGACSVYQDPAADASDDLHLVKSVDRYGSSFPAPLHPRTPVEQSTVPLIGDWMRRVDSRFWCHEFYTNEGRWCRPPRPRTLERIVWLAIAAGATGFTFWQYRSERFGEESNGWGMREINGSPTQRSRVCDEIAAVLGNHGSRLVNTAPRRADVAILFSRECDLLSRIESMPGYGVEFVNANSSTNHHYKAAIRQAHALCNGCGVDVDFVVPGDDLSGYRLLIVPAAEMIDARFASLLRDFVAAGGQAIIEFPFACRDEKTWVTPQRPAHGLETLLGCVEARREVLDGSPCPATFVSGEQVPPVQWIFEFELAGARAIAHWPNQTAAAVCHEYGAGRVFTLSTGLCLNLEDDWDSPATRVMRDLLRQTGIKATTGRTTSLWVRRRRGDDREIWFVFNLNQGPASLELPRPPRAIWYATSAQIRNATIAFESEGCCVVELPV